MTPEPKQVSPDSTLGEALDKLENNQIKISILPVIEKDNYELIGLLRLHDIFS